MFCILFSSLKTEKRRESKGKRRSSQSRVNLCLDPNPKISLSRKILQTLLIVGESSRKSPKTNSHHNANHSLAKYAENQLKCLKPYASIPRNTNATITVVNCTMTSCKTTMTIKWPWTLQMPQSHRNPKE